MAALVTTPSGKVHEFTKLEDAVRTLVIATDALTQHDYDLIVETIRRDPTQVYSYGKWSVKTDLEVRGKGKPILVTEIATNKVLQFDTIKQCAATFGLQPSFVSQVVKRINNIYQGYRFEEAPRSIASGSKLHLPNSQRLGTIHRPNKGGGW